MRRPDDKGVPFVVVRILARGASLTPVLRGAFVRKVHEFCETQSGFYEVSVLSCDAGKTADHDGETGDGGYDPYEHVGRDAGCWGEGEEFL